MIQNTKRLNTLWVGDIENWMDENSLKQLFEKSAKVLSVKIIRDRVTNLPLGYGFVEFETHELAAKVLDQLKNATSPLTNRRFRLNWGVR